MPQPFLINSFGDRRQPLFPPLLLLLFCASGCVFRDGVHRFFLRLLAFLFDACIDFPDHFLPPLLLVAFKKKSYNASAAPVDTSDPSMISRSVLNGDMA